MYEWFARILRDAVFEHRPATSVVTVCEPGYRLLAAGTEDSDSA